MPTKWFLRSRRFWGVVIMVAGYFVEVPPELQTEAPEQIIEAIDGIVMAIGALWTIYGYFKRDKKLTVLPRALKDSEGLPWRK